jgi:hypothetical protein
MGWGGGANHGPRQAFSSHLFLPQHWPLNNAATVCIICKVSGLVSPPHRHREYVGGTPSPQRATPQPSTPSWDQFLLAYFCFGNSACPSFLRLRTLLLIFISDCAVLHHILFFVISA